MAICLLRIVSLSEGRFRVVIRFSKDALFGSPVELARVWRWPSRIVGLASWLRKFCEVKLHEVLYQVVHFLLVVLESLSVDDVFFFQVSQEFPQVLKDLLVHLFIILRIRRAMLLTLNVFADVLNDLIFRVL